MEKRILIVIDMQKDFVDGSLGTQEAQAVLSLVEEKVRQFQGDLIFTLDTHPENYLQTQEGKLLPVEHCIRGSKGWMLSGELEKLCMEKKARVFEKPTFGSRKLAEVLTEEYNEGKFDSVELIGLCTDICVISNALLLKAFMPELPIYVDPKLCAGVTPDKHEAALETMRSCQIQLI